MEADRLVDCDKVRIFINNVQGSVVVDSNGDAAHGLAQQPLRPACGSNAADTTQLICRHMLWCATPQERVDLADAHSTAHQTFPALHLPPILSLTVSQSAPHLLACPGSPCHGNPQLSCYVCRRLSNALPCLPAVAAFIATIIASSSSSIFVIVAVTCCCCRCCCALIITTAADKAHPAAVTRQRGCLLGTGTAAAACCCWRSDCPCCGCRIRCRGSVRPNTSCCCC